MVVGTPTKMLGGKSVELRLGFGGPKGEFLAEIVGFI